MKDNQFSKWIQVSGDMTTVYTHPKFARIFSWVLCIAVQLGLLYIVYANKQAPWVALFGIFFGSILLFNATRKVVFDTKNRTFSVIAWGIVFKKRNWKQLVNYSIGPRIVEYDYRYNNRTMDYGHPLYLHFDSGNVWVAQAGQAAKLKDLAHEIRRILKAEG